MSEHLLYEDDSDQLHQVGVRGCNQSAIQWLRNWS